MTEQFNVVSTEPTYVVEIKVVQHTREFVGVTNYRGEPKDAATTAADRETEVESITFTHTDRDIAIRRAISHLKIIGNME